MAITVVGGDSDAGSAASRSVTVPGGLADGDVAYVFVIKDTNDTTISNSDGFVKLSQLDSTGGRSRSSAIFRKVIVDASGEPGTWSFALGEGESASVTLIVLRGCDTIVPEDVTLNHSEETNVNSPTCQSLTTVTDGCMILVGDGANGISQGDKVTAHGAPSGYTLQDASYTLALSGGVSYKLQASAGASGNATWTNTMESGINTVDHNRMTIAVRPDTGGIKRIGDYDFDEDSSVSSMTKSYTQGSGDNRLLIVQVCTKITGDAVNCTHDSVTFDGNNLTKIEDVSGASGGGTEPHRLTLWYLVAPEVKTANIVASFSKTVNTCSLLIHSWANVDQSSPIGDSDIDDWATQSDPSVILSSAIGEVVIDAFKERNGSNYTEDASQTLIAYLDVPAGFDYGASYKPGAASTTMTWSGPTNASGLIAAALLPAPAQWEGGADIDGVLNEDLADVNGVLIENIGDINGV
jgi:hypothetical protein